MFKSFLLLLCSLFAISLVFIRSPATHHEKPATPILKPLLNQRRQVNGKFSSTTSDVLTPDNTINAGATAPASTTNYGSVNPTNAGSSSMQTITTTLTSTSYSATVTTTIMSTSGSPQSTPTTVTVTVTAPASSTTTVSASVSVSTTAETIYISGSSTSTAPASTLTAKSCADLSAELGGQPYTAPMGDQYNLQCNSYYYVDDDNTLATYYDVETFRDCADLCDQQDGCNLFFLGNTAAGDQAQECFLLSSDEYGQATDSNIADAGMRVGYVSEQISDS